MIVVLDASVVVSAALRDGSVPELALRRALSPPHRLIVSRHVEDEYFEVLFRPKLDRFARLSHRMQIFQAVMTAATLIYQTDHVQDCADPKDNKYLSLAAAGRADVIVTGDLRHLIAMHPWRGIAILRPADYLALP